MAAKSELTKKHMKIDKKTGKKVKVNSKKSAAAMKAAKKRNHTFSAAHRAAISKGRKAALKAGFIFVKKNGKKVRGRKILKQGRPKGSKNKPGSMKPGPKPGTKFGPRKKKAGAKRGRPVGSKNKPKVEAAKKRGRPAKVEAPKRGRPASVKPDVKINRAKPKGIRTD